MANKRISELNSLDGQISSEDLFLVQDVSPISESKSVSWGYLSTVIAASASVESSSYSVTSSFSHKIISASWASSSITSSFALAGSGSGIFSLSSSWAATSSYALIANFASGSGVFASASAYSATSSYAYSGSTSISSSYAISASSASGSGVLAYNSSYALSSSYALTSSRSNYASNGIETGYMVLYAGIDTSTIEGTGDYLNCNGQDVFVSSYQSLYNAIGNKFGFYPELIISASRGSIIQPMYCIIDHDDVNIYGHAQGTGIVTFTTQSLSPIQGIYTVTSLKAGVSGSSQVIKEGNPTVSFTGLGAADYRFTITELNSGESITYTASIHVGGTNVTQAFDLGPHRTISFNPIANGYYNSKFSVIDSVSDQEAVGYLYQTAPGVGIVHCLSASLILPENAQFTCSIIRYSGSYSTLATASLGRSKQTLVFKGVNQPSMPPNTQTFAASFFIPNVNVTGSIPENINPRNSEITSSGYSYAFRYLIKT
jgi:hypothetical protein